MHSFGRITGGGFSGGFNEAIGDAAHGRYHHDAGIFSGGFGHDLCGASNTRRVTDGRAAKFHYL
jgi:hypothetical protein